jgi:hypothetical protein
VLRTMISTDVNHGPESRTHSEGFGESPFVGQIATIGTGWSAFLIAERWAKKRAARPRLDLPCPLPAKLHVSVKLMGRMLGQRTVLQGRVSDVPSASLRESPDQAVGRVAEKTEHVIRCIHESRRTQ